MGLLAFVFGLAIGSFLNVLIARLPKKESILGYSRCPKCQKRISWHENIPVLSFLNLRGLCSKCGSKISRQYPLVELLTGFLFLVYFLIHTQGGDSVSSLIYGLFIISLLIVIGIIDFKHLIIPDRLILTGFVVAIFNFLFTPFYSIIGGDVITIDFICSTVSCFREASLHGLLFFAGVFLFLFFITKGKGIGLGDVKLAGLLGFIFGLRGAINVFGLTFLIGFIIAIILLVFRKATLKSKVPLGSVMAGASILVLLTGLDLLELVNYELILRIWRQ